MGRHDIIKSMKKLLVVSGSPKALGEGSKTYQTCLMINRLAAANFYVDYLSLGDHPLPSAKPEWHRDPFSNDVPIAVREVAFKFKDADCVILASPSYHGSYTSHIKNMIDAFHYDFLRNKRVGLVTIGHGGAAILPAIHLQDVVRTAYGELAHTIICVDGITDFTDSGLLIESKILENRMENLLSELSSQ